APSALYTLSLHDALPISARTASINTRPIRPAAPVIAIRVMTGVQKIQKNGAKNIAICQEMRGAARRLRRQGLKLLRFLQRTSSHLQTSFSSAVNAFHRLTTPGISSAVLSARCSGSLVFPPVPGTTDRQPDHRAPGLPLCRAGGTTYRSGFPPEFSASPGHPGSAL